MVTGYLSYCVHRRAFAVGDALEEVDIVLADHEAHSFLGFVADNFFGGKCRVTNR
ncbi:hypothetical protein D3C86_2101760 [compost metagenome]